jgi:hypothetical protein
VKAIIVGNGAPERIRTADPQIRSLWQLIDIIQYFCKPPSMERTGINGLAATLQTAGSLHYQCIDILVHSHPATVDPVHQSAKISE